MRKVLSGFLPNWSHSPTTYGRGRRGGIDISSSGRRETQGLDLELVQRELAVAEQRPKNLEVFLQNRIAFEEVEHQLQDVDHLFLDLVEHPLVDFPRGEDA